MGAPKAQHRSPGELMEFTGGTGSGFIPVRMCTMFNRVEDT